MEETKTGEKASLQGEASSRFTLPNGKPEPPEEKILPQILLKISIDHFDNISSADGNKEAPF